MSSTTIEQIKARLSITDVVGSYLKLDKAGVNFKACCPFHNEKTPSFFVSPGRESYHCFGCTKGGDIFSFVQDIEGVDFTMALKTLAERAGVELVQGRQENKSAKDRLYEALDKSAKLYSQNLHTAPLVSDYLHGRGLNDTTIGKFSVGYVPDAWRTVVDYLRGQGFNDSEIEQTGLAIKGEVKGGQREAPFYDRFRSRVMFPIKDSGGRVVGFSGRIYGSTGSPQAVEVAKYINSPQTMLYDKSKVLYGFDAAKLAIRQQNVCVLVEGQMDLVLSHQAGITNTVAVSGTALTEEHLRAIRRLAGTLIMAFDGDLAGIKAAKRAIEMALLLEFEVKVAELPDGKDPADLVREDSQKWLAAVEEAKHVIDFYLAILTRGKIDKRVLGQTIREEVLPYVARLASRLDQAHFVKKISVILEITEQPIWEEVDRMRAGVVLKADTSLKAPTKSRLELVSEMLFGMLWWQETPGDQSVVAKYLDQIKNLAGSDFNALLALYEPRKNELVLAAELRADSRNVEAILTDAFEQFRLEFLKDKRNRVGLLLKQAEANGSEEERNLYLKQYQEISQKI